MKKPRLVGLTGGIGVGKTTVAKYLAAQYGALEVAFADPIKVIAKVVLGHDVPEEEKNSPQPMLGGMTARQFYQLVGTDWFVERFGKNIWINVLERRLGLLDENALAVVSDVRNISEDAEATWLRSQGGFIIHLNGPHRRDPGAAHKSNDPVSFDPRCDVWVDNGTSLAALYRSIDSVMHEAGIHKEPRNA